MATQHDSYKNASHMHLVYRFNPETKPACTGLDLELAESNCELFLLWPRLNPQSQAYSINCPCARPIFSHIFLEPQPFCEAIRQPHPLARRSATQALFSFACSLIDQSFVCSFAFLLAACLMGRLCARLPFCLGLDWLFCLADGLALLALANWMESYLGVIAEFTSREDDIVRMELSLG